MNARPYISIGNSGKSAISCRRLTKSFASGTGSVRALSGIDLEINSGEIFFLVGPSGCGKTTLLSILAGLLTPDAGDCHVFGHAFSSLNDEKHIRFRSRHIGMLFQSYHLLPMLSVADNVAIPLLIQGLPWEDTLKPVEDALKAVGMADKAQDKPRKLSGGQQQRVAIARALVHRPQLLLCDEPTSALDHENGERIMELLRELNRTTGMTLVIVTHDNRIFHFAHRIAEMDDGNIRSIYTPQEAPSHAH